MLIQHWIFLSVGYAINLWWKGNSALWEAIFLIPAQQLQQKWLMHIMFMLQMLFFKVIKGSSKES